MVDPFVAQTLTLLRAQLEVAAAGPRQRDQLVDLAQGITATLQTRTADNLLCIHVPRLVANGLGAADETALPVAAAGALVYGAARLVDDVMDGQPLSFGATRGEAVLALAAVNCAAGYRCVTGSPLPDLTKLALVNEVSGMILAMASGQLTDASNFAAWPPVADVMQAIGGKSGAMVAGFARCGAIAAGASPDVIEACGSLGHAAGVARQIDSDLAEIRTRGSADFANEAATLAVALHTAAMADDEKAAFAVRYRSAAGSDRQHADLVAELRRSGALAAAALLAEQARSQAHDAFGRCPLTGDARQQLALLLTLDPTHPGGLT